MGSLSARRSGSAVGMPTGADALQSAHEVRGRRRPWLPARVRDALAASGLLDAAGDWSGGNAEVWFVGRPDGSRPGRSRRGRQTSCAGSGRRRMPAGTSARCSATTRCSHSAMRRFGDSGLVTGAAFGEHRRASRCSWLVNGGQIRDQELLTDEMAGWLADLPALVRTGDDVLIHADTTEYLRWAATLEAINAGVSAVLHGDDLSLVVGALGGMTHAIRLPRRRRTVRARAMLEAAGGSRIVHGHSIIGDLRGHRARHVEEAWLVRRRTRPGHRRRHLRRRSEPRRPPRLTPGAVERS